MDLIELNFEYLGMQKQIIPTDRTQRMDEKKGTFFYFSCLHPKLSSLQCKKLLIFVFSADGYKKPGTVLQNI